MRKTLENEINLTSEKIDLENLEKFKSIADLIKLSYEKIELLKQLRIAIFLKDLDENEGLLIATKGNLTHYYKIDLENNYALRDRLDRLGFNFKIYRGVKNNGL